MTRCSFVSIDTRPDSDTRPSVRWGRNGRPELGKPASGESGFDLGGDSDEG